MTYSIAFLGSMIASADDFEGRITSKELMTIRKHLKDKAYQIIGISYKRPLVSTIQALLVLSVYVEDEVENEDEDMSHW